MRKTNHKKINIPLCAAAVLLYLALVSTYMISGLYARYAVTSSDGASARVAAFVFDVNDTSEHFMDITAVDAPGKSQTFQFVVRNDNASRLSEVAEEYKLALEIHGSLPLTVEVTGADGTKLNLSEPIAQVLESDVRSFPAGEAHTDTYTMTVTWPKSENDLQYANAGLSEIVLRISAWQVD